MGRTDLETGDFIQVTFLAGPGIGLDPMFFIRQTFVRVNGGVWERIRVMVVDYVVSFEVDLVLDHVWI